MEKTIQEEESARIAFQRDDPELNETHPLKNQLEKVSSSIARLAQTIQDQESQISSLTAENPACNSIHPVKVQLADVTEKIEQLVKAIDDQHAQNASLAAEYPELEDEQVINALKQQYLKAIEEIDSQANEELSNLHLGQEEVASRIQSLTVAIDEGRKRLNTLQDELEKRKAKLQDIEQQINDFHTNYLIGKFGSKFQIKQQKSQKKAEAKTISAEIRKLSKELAALDKMIAKAEKKQKKQMEAQRASQIEKAKEDEKARREQEERQQRIKKELEKRDIEQQTVQDNSAIFDHLTSVVRALEGDKYHELLNSEICPLQDDGKRVITNSIVRKQYKQSEDHSCCNRYALIFVDQSGKPISEMRLIDRKADGEETKTSFELKSENGFNGVKYYLLMLNFDTGDLICVQEYNVNISFSNDFDF